MSEDTATIEERENGPLLVKHLPRLTHKGQDADEIKPVVALCRCGASKNKPFCDGSHNEIGFDSSPPEKVKGNKLYSYEGTQATVHYNPLVCSHAAECAKRAPAVFDPKARPWVAPDKGSLDDIREVIAHCPSGALSVTLAGDETATHLRAEAPGVTVDKNGPYRVTGIALDRAVPGEGATNEKFVLCRCGASKNKPYCDGSHAEVGFEAE